jgi:hypothetical protein
MKIFISWSGQRSKQMAQLLDRWIPQVLQATKPWISSDGIDRGAPWFSEITAQLSETMFGVFCLTRDNLTEPWIHYEAGAISKGNSSARVWTFLIDIEHGAVKPPLAQFNHTKPTREDVLKLIKSINRQLGESALADGALMKAFEINWKEFEGSFQQILATTKEGTAPAEPEAKDMMKEIFEQTRGIAKLLRAERATFTPALSGFVTGDPQILDELVAQNYWSRVEAINRRNYQSKVRELAKHQNISIGAAEELLNAASGAPPGQLGMNAKQEEPMENA